MFKEKTKYVHFLFFLVDAIKNNDATKLLMILEFLTSPHLSRSCVNHGGINDALATKYISLFLGPLPVHSAMLPSHLFVCLPLRLPP